MTTVIFILNLPSWWIYIICTPSWCQNPQWNHDWNCLYFQEVILFSLLLHCFWQEVCCHTYLCSSLQNAFSLSSYIYYWSEQFDYIVPRQLFHISCIWCSSNLLNLWFLHVYQFRKMSFFCLLKSHSPFGISTYMLSKPLKLFHSPSHLILNNFIVIFIFSNSSAMFKLPLIPCVSF